LLDGFMLHELSSSLSPRRRGSLTSPVSPSELRAGLGGAITGARAMALIMLSIAVKLIAGLTITVCGLGLIALAVEDWHEVGERRAFEGIEHDAR